MMVMRGTKSSGNLTSSYVSMGPFGSIQEHTTIHWICNQGSRWDYPEEYFNLYWQVLHLEPSIWTSWFTHGQPNVHDDPRCRLFEFMYALDQDKVNLFRSVPFKWNPTKSTPTITDMVKARSRMRIGERCSSSQRPFSQLSILTRNEQSRGDAQDGAIRCIWVLW